MRNENQPTHTNTTVSRRDTTNPSREQATHDGTLSHERDLTAREVEFDVVALPRTVLNGSANDADDDESDEEDWMEAFRRENGLSLEDEEQTGQQQGLTEPEEGNGQEPEVPETADDDSLFGGDLDENLGQIDAQPLLDSEDTAGDALDAEWARLTVEMDAQVEQESEIIEPAVEIPTIGKVEADNHPPPLDVSPEPAVPRQQQPAPTRARAAPAQKVPVRQRSVDMEHVSAAVRRAAGNHKVFAWQGNDQKTYLESVRNQYKPPKRSADEEVELVEQRFRKRIRPSGPGTSEGLPIVIEDDDDGKQQSPQPRLPTPNTRGSTAETALVVDDGNDVPAPVLAPAPGPMANQPQHGHMWSGFRPPAPLPAGYPQPQPQHHHQPQPQPFPKRQLPVQNGYPFAGALQPLAVQQLPLLLGTAPPQHQWPAGHPQQLVVPQPNGMGQAQQQLPVTGPAQQHYLLGGNQAIPQQPATMAQQNFGQQQNLGSQGYQQQPRYRFYAPLPQGNVPQAGAAYALPNAHPNPNPLGSQPVVAPQAQGNAPRTVMVSQIPNDYLFPNGYQPGPNNGWNM
ncbi:hypothetical protein QBC40DRAFT_258824 [Triangularia verruculosa]|uniref:Uncharacterized protein n=1 Tax=Triangularia verruculosa TaxID=2587418 RepID=A0AAN7ARA0_9PEZI|nr:hypothetical protein QBC40DRAFT_258824 [Triangularia verruculosa]